MTPCTRILHHVGIPEPLATLCVRNLVLFDWMWLVITWFGLQHIQKAFLRQLLHLFVIPGNLFRMLMLLYCVK